VACDVSALICCRLMSTHWAESICNSVLHYMSLFHCLVSDITAAVSAVKPEATAIGDPQDGRWKITLVFDVRGFCIPKFRSSTL